MTNCQTCSHCDGKGYVEIRDCTGEVQREETCLFCSGSGIVSLSDTFDS